MHKIEYFSKKGKDKFTCEDNVYIWDCGDIQVFSLADGVGSKKYALEGAKAVQKAIGEYCVQYGDEIMKKEELIKADFIAIVKEVLYNLSKKNAVEQSEFASTLLMLIASKKEKTVRWIHIGDGLIGAVKGNELKIISYPRNGVTREYTFCTASRALERHLRTGIISMESRMFLMTDGAMWKCYANREFTENGERIIKEGVWNVEKYLDEQDIFDDYSMLEVYFEL